MNKSLQHKPGTLDPSYLLTFFIHNKKIGDQFVEWPLHVTIIPWFFVRKVNELDKSLSDLANMQESITITGKEKTAYGDREVCLIEPTYSLGQIHRAIFARLKALDATFINTKFFGDNYTPHITRQDDTYFSVGDKAELGEFYFVKRHREQATDKYIKIIAKEYRFNG